MWCSVFFPCLYHYENPQIRIFSNFMLRLHVQMVILSCLLIRDKISQLSESIEGLTLSCTCGLAENSMACQWKWHLLRQFFPVNDFDALYLSKLLNLKISMIFFLGDFMNMWHTIWLHFPWYWRLIIHPCFFLWPPFLSFSNLLKQWLYRGRFDFIICTCWRLIIHPCFFSWCPFSSFSNLIFQSNDYRGSFEGVEVFLVFPSEAYSNPLSRANYST